MAKKPKSDRELKTPRHKTKQATTIEDILARDDVNAILERLDKVKPDIKTLIAIYEDGDGDISWKITTGSQLSKVIYLLEVVKQDLLTDD